jgi:hypothetical protein
MILFPKTYNENGVFEEKIYVFSFKISSVFNFKLLFYLLLSQKIVER